MFELFIQVDTNDGDYVTSCNPISQEQLDQLLPIVEAIKNKNGQWENDSSLEDIQEKYYPEIPFEKFCLLEYFLPYPEYGFHTINRVEYYPMPEKIKLL